MSTLKQTLDAIDALREATLAEWRDDATYAAWERLEEAYRRIQDELGEIRDCAYCGEKRNAGHVCLVDCYICRNPTGCSTCDNCDKIVCNDCGGDFNSPHGETRQCNPCRDLGRPV